VLVDLIDERAVTLCDKMSIDEDMGLVHMERFENSGAVGDDEKGAVLALLVFLDSLGNSADRIDIKTGVCLIEDRQGRI